MPGDAGTDDATTHNNNPGFTGKFYGHKVVVV